jgi:uncharacterized protein
MNRATLWCTGSRRTTAIAFAATLLFLIGCGQKSPTSSQIHAVTAEIVAAAQNATNHKATVTVHTEPRTFHGIPFGVPPVDNIYFSLSDASQDKSLEHAFTEIARRHRMSIVETSSGGVNRYDLSLRGTRTHTVRIAMQLHARIHPAVPHGGSARLAIIVDDLGNDRSAGSAIIALPFPVTISVLPDLPYSTETAESAFRRGKQVLLHLPMEANSGVALPEGRELHVGMRAEEVPTALTGMLATVPHAVGVNNHEGSRATSDPALMDALMPALRERGLFFIDSRTTPATVAYDAAERFGVAAASRKVFLDDLQTRGAIEAQLDLAATDAIRDGSAIAIGHPHPETIAALSENLSLLEASGIRLVFASELVH